MRGFSLLEFLLGMTLFLFLLIYGYSSFDQESKLIDGITIRCRPEEESNYRLLVLKNLFQDALIPFQRDWRLAEVPIFFTDLNFSKEVRTDSFSVARSNGPALDFALNSGWIETAQPFSFSKGDLLVMAGSTAASAFDWNYALVADVASPQKMKIDPLLTRDVVVSGSLMKVEIDGFRYRKGTLYFVPFSGPSQPFFGPLESFQYIWQPPQLTISWRAGLITSNFRATL